MGFWSHIPGRGLNELSSCVTGRRAGPFPERQQEEELTSTVWDPGDCDTANQQIDERGAGAQGPERVMWKSLSGKAQAWGEYPRPPGPQGPPSLHASHLPSSAMRSDQTRGPQGPPRPICRHALGSLSLRPPAQQPSKLLRREVPACAS